MKPRITRKFAICVDEVEGVCRIECRTNLITLTRFDLGRIITEFMYQRGALPADQPESIECEEA